jgi:hypothetical protein
VDQYRSLNILKYRQAGEDIGPLKRPPHAQPADLMGGQVGDVYPFKDQFPLIGRKVAGYQVEKSRLPGAVGTDDGTDFPFFDGQAHPIYRYESIEGFLHFFNV